MAPDQAVDGFEPDAFAHLAELEAGHFWFRARNRLIVWALGSWFPRAESFLEVGCGTGFVLAAIERDRPDLSLAGADLFAEGLRFGQRRLSRTPLYQADARFLPFEEAWDAIGAFDVLEHIEDDQAALMGMHGALRAGGGVLVTVPQHRWLWSDADDYGRHVRRYTRRELVSKLRRAGFEVAFTTSFVSLLFPAMAAGRLLERVRRGPFDPIAELTLPRRVNDAFERTMALELAMIRRGVRFPFGGSLLAAAFRV